MESFNLILTTVLTAILCVTVIVIKFYHVQDILYKKRIIKQNEQTDHYNDTTVYDNDITVPVIPNLKIIGSPDFILATYQVLDELHEKAPARYREAISNLAQYTQTCKMLADTSDYEAFRYQFLQVVARCVCCQRDSNYSEEAVNEYVSQILEEMGA